MPRWRWRSIPAELNFGAAEETQNFLELTLAAGDLDSTACLRVMETRLVRETLGDVHDLCLGLS